MKKSTPKSPGGGGVSRGLSPRHRIDPGPQTPPQPHLLWCEVKPTLPCMHRLDKQQCHRWNGAITSTCGRDNSAVRGLTITDNRVGARRTLTNNGLTIGDHSSTTARS